MGRRLAEATKARRTRRTRGEAGLCFFRVAAATGFFLAVVVLAALGAVGLVFAVAGAVAAGDVLSVGADDCE